MKKLTIIQEYKEKLKSKRGSSLLMSLLFSAVTVTISAVILNAAVSSNGRITDTAESSQPYYLVSSLFSVFDYEASSKSDGGGMEFTVELKGYDPNAPQTVETMVGSNVVPSITYSGILTEVLEDQTRLNTLKNHIAYCLSKAMLSGETAARSFSVTVGGELAKGGLDCNSYQIDGRVSVNAVDYTIRIDVIGISELSGSGSTLKEEPQPLPEICTLLIPTEKVEIRRLEDITVLSADGNKQTKKERPLTVKFTYQKAKYLSTTDTY